MSWFYWKVGWLRLVLKSLRCVACAFQGLHFECFEAKALLFRQFRFRCGCSEYEVVFKYLSKFCTQDLTWVLLKFPCKYLSIWTLKDCYNNIEVFIGRGFGYIYLTTTFELRTTFHSIHSSRGGQWLRKFLPDRARSICNPSNYLNQPPKPFNLRSS